MFTDLRFKQELISFLEERKHVSHEDIYTSEYETYRWKQLISFNTLKICQIFIGTELLLIFIEPKP